MSTYCFNCSAVMPVDGVLALADEPSPELDMLLSAPCICRLISQLIVLEKMLLAISHADVYAFKHGALCNKCRALLGSVGSELTAKHSREKGRVAG